MAANWDELNQEKKGSRVYIECHPNMNCEVDLVLSEMSHS
jgi:hypothetical protein